MRSIPIAASASTSTWCGRPGQGPRRADEPPNRRRWTRSCTTSSGTRGTRRSRRRDRRPSATGWSTHRRPRRRGSWRSSGRGRTTTDTPRTCSPAIDCSTTSCTTGSRAPGRRRPACTGRASGPTGAPRSPCRRGCRSSPRRSSARRGGGPNDGSPTSATGTSSTRAATSPPSSSPATFVDEVRAFFRTVR